MDILRTYYYDYHCLRISIQSSIILLECDQFELQEAVNLGYDDNKKQALINKIDARTKILNKQKLLLDNMNSVINALPKQFNGVEHLVFQLRYMQGLTPSEIADTLCYTENYIYRISSKIIDKFSSYLKSTKEMS